VEISGKARKIYPEMDRRSVGRAASIPVIRTEKGDEDIRATTRLGERRRWWTMLPRLKSEKGGKGGK